MTGSGGVIKYVYLVSKLVTVLIFPTIKLMGRY